MCQIKGNRPENLLLVDFWWAKTTVRPRKCVNFFAEKSNFGVQKNLKKNIVSEFGCFFWFNFDNYYFWSIWSPNFRTITNKEFSRWKIKPLSFAWCVFYEMFDFFFTFINVSVVKNSVKISLQNTSLTNSAIFQLWNVLFQIVKIDKKKFKMPKLLTSTINPWYLLLP